MKMQPYFINSKSALKIVASVIVGRISFKRILINVSLFKFPQASLERYLELATLTKKLLFLKNLYLSRSPQKKKKTIKKTKEKNVKIIE